MAQTIASGETKTVDTLLYADETDLDGTLVLNGTVVADGTGEASASGTGAATGTADATPTRAASALGTGEGVALVGLPDIAAGETTVIAAGETRAADTLVIDGTLELSGTLESRRVGSTAERRASARGEGTATGTAEATPTRFATAAGEGLATGRANALVFKRLLLRDTTSIDNTRRDEFTAQGTGEAD